MLDVLFQNPILFIMLLGALVISITIHEFSHAFMTDRLGDPTARYYNRVTLDPRAHLDPYGMLFLVLAGFGWGKPVPFNTINLKNPRADGALIALAGPVSNFLLALLLSLLLRFMDFGMLVNVFLRLTAYYNVSLGVFNLLPFHPLDGFKVLYGMLPVNMAWQWKDTEKYGVFILILFMFTGSFSKIISPAIAFLVGILGL
jgi:Zn-dependent protease